MVSAAAAKNRPPFSACTGAKVEMITPGGEVAFVSQMIEESLRLRDKVQWYTTMLGKLSSVSVIVQNLIDCGNKNWAVTEFVQGNRTKRWAVGWSWTDLRPAVDAARGLTSSSIPKHLLPFPSEFTFHAASTSIDKVCRDVDGQMRALPRSAWTWQPMRSRGVLLVKEDVWSRRARRKFQQQQQQQDQDKLQQTSADVDESNAALGVAVQVKQELDTSRGPTVLIRWLKGSDHVLYESFCGMLKRKLTEK
ncbi:hypothetical protein VTN49DRAFT_815 [Thermomyces lanuginosus]|uniref:uncharacterized protein n=1 Tax=Thermomyces lanuginosus TaxID=5541 RepID=UPI003742411E